MSSSFASRESSSSLFVPDALKFYVNRLSFSKNRVRLQALSSQRASSSSQIIVRLPSNTMINLASLTMTGSVRATIASAVAGEGVALPTNWDYSFIETLSLIANGGIITQPFTNYKLLGNTLNDVYGSNAKVFSRSGLQGSLPSPLIEVSGIVASEEQQYVPFSINSWISATQTMAPSYIATNLLGDLELRLTMADTSILQTGTTADGKPKAGLQQRANWDMKDINFYVETCSLDSVVLDQAIQAKLASGEGINVPFENVFSFSQTNGGDSFNQRFSVSSQSINKIVAVSQLQSDLSPPQGDDGSGDNRLGQRKYVNGIPQALRRNVCGATQAQFSINNQYSPNYQINSELGAGYSPVDGTSANYQMSSGLVETVAAMDIPDYDYDCGHKLTSTTQMPFEFLGGGAVVGANSEITGYIQPPSSQILQEPDAGAVDQNASVWFEPYVYKSGIDTYLEDKYVVATSFDLDVCDKDRVISGVNTIGSNAQLFYNVVGGGRIAPGPDGNKNVSNIFVICTSMVQIYAGSALKIIQ